MWANKYKWRVVIDDVVHDAQSWLTVKGSSTDWFMTRCLLVALGNETTEPTNCITCLVRRLDDATEGNS